MKENNKSTWLGFIILLLAPLVVLLGWLTIAEAVLIVIALQLFDASRQIEQVYLEIKKE